MEIMGRMLSQTEAVYPQNEVVQGKYFQTMMCVKMGLFEPIYVWVYMYF